MTLHAGEKVVYPYRGPCRIGAVVKKEFQGGPIDFYQLTVMDDSGDMLFVPVDKVENLGIRRLMKKSEMPKLLNQLSHKAETVLPNTVAGWRQRAVDNSKLLASGSAFDLAKVIGSLTELGRARVLSPRDRLVLHRARKNLICEISAVMGESKSVAEEKMNNALKRKHETKGFITAISAS
jgi:RNA polymerase-interacting CarD/CdnL/TRCF family regulator